MAVFRREEDIFTSGLPALWPLRMRVRRSAMGSVMLMPRPSPARLGKARNLAAVRDLANLHARQSEFAIDAARASRDGAAVAAARRTRVARQLLQPHLRRRPLLLRGLGTANEFL